MRHSQNHSRPPFIDRREHSTTSVPRAKSSRSLVLLESPAALPKPHRSLDLRTQHVPTLSRSAESCPRLPARNSSRISLRRSEFHQRRGGSVSARFRPSMRSAGEIIFRHAACLLVVRLRLPIVLVPTDRLEVIPSGTRCCSDESPDRPCFSTTDAEAEPLPGTKLRPA